MNKPIADEVKVEMIRLWLGGLQRDRIAMVLKVGAGTVSHVISEWKYQLGVPTAESLRILSIHLRGLDLSPIDCAEGCRFTSQLNDCHISREEIIPFILRIYKKCISSNASSGRIFDVCKQIADLETSVSIVQLPELISEQVKTKQTLEKEIAALQKTQEGLQEEVSSLFHRARITEYDLEKYKETRRGLRNYGRSLDDPQKVVNILENIEKIGSDPNKIAKEFADTKNFQHEKSDLEEKVAELRSVQTRAEQELQLVEEKLASGKQLLFQYKEIEKTGIGSEELKALKSIILGIATTNSLHPKIAFRRFADDLLTNYDVKLGLDGKIGQKTRELSAAQRRLDLIKMEYSELQNECDTVGELLNHDLQGADIIEISDIIKASGNRYSRIKQDLQLYGNLQNVVSWFTARKEELELEISRLSVGNNTLKSERDMMLEKIASLIRQYKAIEQDNDGRMGRKVLEYEIRMKEIRNAYVVAKAQTIESIKALEAKEKQQMSQLHKINIPFEFSPIVEAARGYAVDGERLRQAVTKSMELLIQRSDENYNGQARSDMLQALKSLKSEFIIF